MENDPFIDDLPIETSIYEGFSMAMLNYQRVTQLNLDSDVRVGCLPRGASRCSFWFCCCFHRFPISGVFCSKKIWIPSWKCWFATMVCYMFRYFLMLSIAASRHLACTMPGVSPVEPSVALGGSLFQRCAVHSSHHSARFTHRLVAFAKIRQVNPHHPKRDFFAKPCEASAIPTVLEMSHPQIGM